jgi:serine/threonine protein kinase
MAMAQGLLEDYGDDIEGLLENYEIRAWIGEGQYGRVYEGLRKETGERVALKKIALEEDEGVPATAIREVASLKSLQHSNIVRLLDVVCNQSRTSLTFVFEYMEGDLRQYVKAKNPLPADTLRSMFFQILLGVSFSHAQRVIHRDLKPQNILIRNQTPKIADFGLARAVTTPHMPFTREVVTLWYRAPEILLGSSRYSTPVDMWSCGCILAEMATGSALFNGDSEFGTLMRIFELCGTPSDENFPGVTELPHFNRNFPQWKRPKFETVLASGPNLTEPGLALLQSLLTYPTTERITPRKACRHTYFSGLDISGYDTGHLQSIDVHLGLA